LTKLELAELIGKDVKTLRNWEKTNPKLIELINKGLKYDNEPKQEHQILKFFYELTEEEQELYLSEIKARVLRKKINK